jgi:hypothetical protein
MLLDAKRHVNTRTILRDSAIADVRRLTDHINTGDLPQRFGRFTHHL